MMKRKIITCFFWIFSLSLAFSQEKLPLNDYRFQAKEDTLEFLAGNKSGEISLTVNQEVKTLHFKNGKATLPFDMDAAGRLILLKAENLPARLYHVAEITATKHRIRHIPLWLSIIPPLVAIGLALLFREVLTSLFAGVWAGAFIAGGMRVDSFYYIFLSFLKVVQKYIIGSLMDTGHLSVIVFSLLIGGMVAIISRNGGMAGIVKSLSKYARTPSSAQFITWLLGVAIFFDDYANTLIVGNTMRSITDKFKISREKLAYIVDSTAAPVAAVAFVTTWIGAELGYIADGIGQLEGFDQNLTPYSLFLGSLKYAYYPVLTLGFILMIIYFKKDFGPMHKAEVRARKTGKVSSAATPDDDEPDMEDLSPVKGAPLRWYNAAIPVLAVVLMTIYGLIDTGMETTFRQITAKGTHLPLLTWQGVWQNMDVLFQEKASFVLKTGTLIGNSDSFVALLWGSLTGVVLAILMTLAQKLINLHNTMFTMLTGFKTMLPALAILTLAWALAITTRELHTATFLTAALKGAVNPYMMPLFIFILSALISFSTGSSWSTMAILFPIAIPTTWSIAMAAGLEHDAALEILMNVIRGVLGAAVFGDHSSPISDTTILSSLASDCNHIDHVRTQLPYALTVGIVSAISVTLVSFIGGGWGVNTLVLFLDFVILAGLLMRFGRRV